MIRLIRTKCMVSFSCLYNTPLRRQCHKLHTSQNQTVASLENFYHGDRAAYRSLSQCHCFEDRLDGITEKPPSVIRSLGRSISVVFTDLNFFALEYHSGRFFHTRVIGDILGIGEIEALASEQSFYYITSMKLFSEPKQFGHLRVLQGSLCHSPSTQKRYS